MTALAEEVSTQLRELVQRATTEATSTSALTPGEKAAVVETVLDEAAAGLGDALAQGARPVDAWRTVAAARAAEREARSSRARWPARPRRRRLRVAEAQRKRRHAEEQLRRVVVLDILAPMVDRALAEQRQQAFDERPLPPSWHLRRVDSEPLTVPTEASRRLDERLASSAVVRVGVGGARGIGKTTLLRHLTSAGRLTVPGQLRVAINAVPAEDPRDITVHVFTELCRAVRDAGVDPDRPPTPGSLPAPAPGDLRPAGRGLRDWWPSPVRVATGVSTVASAVTVGLLADQPIASLAGEVAERPGAVSATVAVVAAAVAVRLARRPAPTAGPYGARTARLAEEHLRRLTQLGTASDDVTGKFASRGVEIGRGRTRQQAEVPRPYPVLVADLRRFLDEVRADQARQYGITARVLVVVDDADKVAPAEKAERYLERLRVVLDDSGCSYVVTVPELLLAEHEARAVAGRNTLDTAFDTLLRLQPLDVAGADALLRSRDLRLPPSFVALCHCLSGGVPRELIRVAEAVLDECTRLGRRAVGDSDVAAVAAALIESDHEATTRGLTLAARPPATAGGPGSSSSARTARDDLTAVYAVYVLALRLAFIEGAEYASQQPADLALLAEARESLANDPSRARSLVESFLVGRGWTARAIG